MRSSDFRRERGHEMQIKGPEESGDDRQECMKCRFTEALNAVYTEIQLRQIILV